MTTDEKIAGILLIRTLRDARNGLVMAAGIKPQALTEGDLTFAMEQAMLVADRIASALAACREANREAHKLVR